MGDLKDIAENGAAIVVGAFALCSAPMVASALPLAIPAAALAAIALDHRSASAKSILTRSQKRVHKALSACPDLTAQDIAGAKAAFAGKNDLHVRVEDIVAALASPAPEEELTQRLFGAPERYTPGTQTILRLTVTHALQDLRDGKLQAAITQELALTILRDNRQIKDDLQRLNAYIELLSETTISTLKADISTLEENKLITRELIVSIAQRVAPDVSDFHEAITAIKRAIDCAIQMDKEGQTPSNHGEHLDQIFQRVTELNRAGDLDEGARALQAAKADSIARQKAETARHQTEMASLLDRELTQQRLRRDAPAFASAAMERRELETDGAKLSFNQLQALQDELYVRGRDFGDRFDLEVSIELAQRCRDLAPSENDRAAALNNLGNALRNQGIRTAGPKGARLLGEAVTAYHKALRVYTEDTQPLDWATTQNNLGNALSNQGAHTAGPEGARLLGEAVTAYHNALRVYTKDTQPLQWAMTQNNLGNALQEQGSRTAGPEGARLLGEAVTAYHNALRVYTEDTQPLNWAMTQNNLGNALSNQGIRTAGPEGARLLGEAVTAYHNALRVYTEDTQPLQWAVTQNNLGNALSDQGERTAGPEGARLLGEAVTAYRNALRVRTEDAQPLQWAVTQNNLGNALSDQGERTAGPEGARLLGEAVTAYHNALRVRTEDAQPPQWAMTQENLALAEQARARHDSCTDPAPHLRAALDHVTAALRVYDPTHQSYDHDTATRLRDDLRAALAAGGEA